MLRTAMGSVAILGDALGVLHDARKFRAKDPVLNEIMAELALIVAPLGLELQAMHLWTQRNRTCDALSRLTSTSTVPEELANVHRCPRKQLSFRLLRSEQGHATVAADLIPNRC